jgi:hypothetical protein
MFQRRFRHGTVVDEHAILARLAWTTEDEPGTVHGGA